MTSQLKQDLRSVRDILTPKENWTKNEYARDGAGKFVNPWSSEAKCYCLQGACVKAVGLDTWAYDDLQQASRLEAVIKALGRDLGGLIIGFNDAESTTHDQVLALIDKAIEAAP